MASEQVIEREVSINNALGLHARAAASFVKIANRFRANISVRKEKVAVNGKSIMGVLMLAASKGAKIAIRASGQDAQEAVDALCELVEAKFGEE